MHSFGRVLVLGGLLSARGALAAEATITPAPTAQEVDLKVKRQDGPDAISLARMLLTAVPESIREVAATNIAAASSILWEEFLGGKRPEWFLELPEDIQSYLVREFGPKPTWPTARPTNSWWAWPSVTTTSRPTTSTFATSRTPPSNPSSSRSGSSTRQSGSTPSPSHTTLRSSRLPSSTPAGGDSSSSSPSSTTTSSATSSSSSTPISDSPEASNDGLTKSQKIGLGVGIPIGLLGAAALFFACCTLFRRRQKKNVDGSIPPSSPGFIPRFAFQERPADDPEHRTPLNRDVNHSVADLGPQQPVDWEDDGVDPADMMGIHNPYMMNTPYTLNDYGAPATGQMPQNPLPVNPHSITSPQGAGMSMYDPTPIMAPALFHTHSSNRARGMRTSYTSLHSVAEVTEPDESADHTLESPVLGRNASGASAPRSLLPSPPIPVGATIKRKPVSASPPPPPPVPKSPRISASPAANVASRKLLRQTMPEHSGSSSSGLTLTTTTSTSTKTNTSSTGLSSTSGLVLSPPTITTHSTTHPASAHNTPSPVSPLSSNAPSNPFQYDSYVEDYGPEYQGAYVDVEDGLYGGHTSLSRYPETRKGSGGRRSSKTEWPLRNLVGSVSGSGHRRKSSPLWGRINEE